MRCSRSAGEFGANFALCMHQQQSVVRIGPCGEYKRGWSKHQRLTHERGSQCSRAEHETLDPCYARKEKMQFERHSDTAAARAE